MTELKKINIYKYDCDGFKQWIRERVLQALNKETDEESMHRLFEAVRMKILCVANDAVHLSCSEGRIECKRIGRGATSACYENTSSKEGKQIIKEFNPSGFICEPISTQDITSNRRIEFQWLAESSPEQEKRFLKRFTRFILQEDEIEFARSESDAKQRNLFVVPNLVLSSIGFIYRSQSFFGKTLKTVFKYHNEDRIKELLEKIDWIKQSAEYVKKICHDNKIYHGDIKPSNFFAIGDFENDKIVKINLIQNIDFDTWVHSACSETSILADWDMMATTPLYYYGNTERIKPNQTFETLQAYDVRALSRMLMYALICMFDKEEDLYKSFENDIYNFDWIDFFYIKSGAGEALLSELKTNIKTQRESCASALFIFECIKSLILGCTARVKRSKRVLDVKAFVEKIEEIEKLLNLYLENHSVGIDTNAIRYFGLKLLDEERLVGLLPACYTDFINAKMSPREKDRVLLRNWVVEYIGKNYYKQDENDYDKIDRHLIPDIDLGDGSEPLAYKFDDEGRPTSVSPLEQALDKAEGKSLFLTAEGGQGKTTTLRSFWLDFLSGRHNMPCLYVNAKMLNANDGVMTIHKYISNNEKGYNFTLSDAKIKPLLLVDGANESDAELRQKEKGKDCLLVKNIKDLIGDYRVVVGSRSNVIATINNEDNDNQNSKKSNEHEFENNMVYAVICELDNDQIEHRLGVDFVNVKDKQPMIDLLRNNMMLHIYMELKADGAKLNEPDMKPGILLDKYFNRCFMARYFKHICHLSEDEQTICELIENASKENTYNCNNVSENKIHKELDDYKSIVNYLIDNSSRMTFIVTELENKKIVCAVLCELSLLKKIDDTKYTWANEIYQEYFEALYIKKIINNIYELSRLPIYAELIKAPFHDYSNFDDISSVLSDIINDDSRDIYDNMQHDTNKMAFKDDIKRIKELHCHKAYHSFLYAGELLLREYNDDDLSELFSRVIKLGSYLQDDGNASTQLFSYLTRGTWEWKDAVTIVSVLSGNGIPKEIRHIGSHIFDSCDCLININIPSHVVSIGKGAFYLCDSLKTIVIGSKIVNVVPGAFDGCNNLKQILVDKYNKVYHADGNCLIDTKNKCIIAACKGSAIPKDGSVEQIGHDGAFNGLGGYSPFAGLEICEIFIPDSIKSIAAHSFSDCYKLRKVVIGSGVEEISPHAFDACINLEEINISNQNNNYCSKGNCIIDKRTKTVILGCATSIIPSDADIDSIGVYAFSRNNNLKKIYIPKNIIKIEHDAFWNCNNIEEITVDENNEIYRSVGNCLINIKNRAIILGCVNSIIPREEYARYIDKKAFSCCDGLRQITIPGNIITIGESAFDRCRDLELVKIEEGVKNIEQFAFFDCYKLTHINIPSSMYTIGMYVFDGCNGIRIAINGNWRADGTLLTEDQLADPERVGFYFTRSYYGSEWERDMWM